MRISSCWHLSFFFLLNRSLPGSLIPASVCLCYSFSLGSCVRTGERLLRQAPSARGSPQGSSPHGETKASTETPAISTKNHSWLSPPSVWIPDTLFWCFHFRFHSRVLDLLSGPINKQTNNTKPFFKHHFLPVTIWILCSHCSKGFQIRYSQLPSLRFLLLFSLQPTAVPNAIPTPPLKQLLSRFPASHVSQPVVPSACHLTRFLPTISSIHWRGAPSILFKSLGFLGTVPH